MHSRGKDAAYTTKHSPYSERLSSIKLRIKRFVSYTQVQSSIFNLQSPTKNALASCTTSVYVNLSKNSSFSSRSQGVSLKADAKVRIISETTKLFGKKFRFTPQFLFTLDLCQTRKPFTPYYIIYIGIAAPRIGR